jgi:hypothetical protein
MFAPRRRRTIRSCVALLAAVTAASAALHTPLQAQAKANATGAPTLTPELAKVRAGLERYQDPIVAVRDGYLSTVGCVEYPAGGHEHTVHYAPGGMGVHLLNAQLVGPTLDPAKPQVLIYEPDGDKLRLAAAEWFVPAQVAGKNVPMIFGRKLDGPMEGHEPVMAKDFHHYDLHVWLWKNNPAGVFSPTNPAVKCPARGYSFAEQAPKLVPAAVQQ